MADRRHRNAPTAQQFQSALGSVTSLQILPDIPTFTDLAFDNVRLQGVTAAPEPQSAVLAAVGFALLGLGLACRHKLHPSKPGGV